MDRLGESHDDRGLKNRPNEDVRLVPIPPHLVTILREHIETFGTADDGRLFFSESGGVVSSSTYYRAWQEARTLALPPAVVASPLARRPYDLRHSALSTWLNAGVDATEVAERAGNSVEVLLGRYAKCLDGGKRSPTDDRGPAARVRVSDGRYAPRPLDTSGGLRHFGGLTWATAPRPCPRIVHSPSYGRFGWHTAAQTPRPRLQLKR